MYACPKCHTLHKLRVALDAWARFVVSYNTKQQPYADLLDIQIPSNDWSGDSAMRCENCGHEAAARTFFVEPHSSTT